MKNIFLFMLCLISVGSFSYANDIPAHEFCESFEQIVKNKNAGKKITFLQAFQILYLTRTLIDPIELNSDENDGQRSSTKDGKYIFVNLKDDSYDKNAYKDIQKNKKHLKKIKLFKQLRKIKDKESCLNAIADRPNDYQAILDYIKKEQASSLLFKQYKNSKIMSLTMHQLKAFKRRGWHILKIKDIYELYEYLAGTHITHAILINHADELGRLYDAQNNLFPKGAFLNLPDQLKSLTVFSCHPDKVIENYQISQITKRINYFYPKVKENFQDFFGENIPVLSIRSMLKIEKYPIKSTKPAQTCEIEIKNNTASSKMIIELNHALVSATNLDHQNVFKIDCQLIDLKKNMIKIHGDSKQADDVEIAEIIIRKNNLSMNLNVKKYLSQDQKRHIVTIGTIGGNL
jgi:hypothetical protein